MARIKLGELIELNLEQNTEKKHSADAVRGMTITKEIIPTKASVTNTDLEKFYIVRPFDFIFNPRTHGYKIGFGFNNTPDTFIISWNNISFRVSKNGSTKILPIYLFLHFNRNEWDREACYNSWGSSTEVFSWETLCDMEIDLPSIPEQQKVVDVYNAMIANQKSYEAGLESLKLTCDAYIENLRREIPSEAIGKYIEQRNEKNIGNKIKLAQGVNVDMQFMPAKRIAEDKQNAKVVYNGQFAYNKVMKANGTKLPIALRNGTDCYVSGSYQVFEVKRKNELLSEYLMLWLSRTEIQRYAGFISWGSTRDVLDFETLGEIEIPIPNIEIQQAIVNIYNAYIMRKEINEKLKQQIKDICPILIRGSLKK